MEFAVALIAVVFGIALATPQQPTKHVYVKEKEQTLKSQARKVEVHADVNHRNEVEVDVYRVESYGTRIEIPKANKCHGKLRCKEE